MAINIESSSNVQAEVGDYLMAAQVADWITNVPEGARIDAIMRDYGSQRDPMPVLVGLKASWSETR